MVSLAIMGIGILGLFGAFRFITRSLYVSRVHTLATNLAQEKIESLKNLSYFELAITTAALADNSFTPPVLYDSVAYPGEVISIGGVQFKRYTYVALAQVDGSNISTVTYTYPDTGLKQITVTIAWTDNGVPKKWSLTNLIENPTVNPLDTGLAGDVRFAVDNSVLSGAQVRIDQNTDWSATSASNGSYSFRVYHGSYTVRVSSAGFYDGVSALIDADAGSNITVPTIQLTQIATGTVIGTAWLSPDLVISGVAVSSKQADQNMFEAQYIELYNPTTAAIDIGDNGINPTVKLNFQSNCPGANDVTCTDATLGIKLTYISTYVAPGHYYLVANTNTVTLNGDALAADAIYTDDANGSCSVPPSAANWNTGASPPLKKLLVNGHDGSVWLTRGSTILDAVGWLHTGNANPPHCEGTCMSVDGAAGGFPIDEQVVRLSSPAANLSIGDEYSYGRAYDAGNNATDFTYTPALTGIQVAPRATTWATYAPITGVPAVGAIVASSDPYSGSAAAAADYISSGTYSLLYAPFSLPGVTTGTWQITVASGAYYNQYTPVNVAQNTRIAIPNAATTPAWPAANVFSARLTSGTLSGFVKGSVTNINNNPLSGIVVTANGTRKTTGSNGGYFIATDTGPVTVVCNPIGDAGFNSQYVQSITAVTLTEGAITTQNFSLSKGGAVTGYVTSGTTPLPNYEVAATISGSQFGQAASDSSGYFTIHNLSTGTYTVAPVLEIGQDSTPNSIDVTVGGTGTVFVGTFTVLGALGSIIGSATYNGATLTTGALLVASTATIGNTPSTIVASSAPAQAPLYAGSVKADGSYNLPVRGGYSYHLSVYVPVISGTSVSITTKTYSGISVTPNEDTTQNITVP